MRRLCAISVDLDEIPNYRAIHGRAATTPRASDTAVYDVAVPRLVEVAASLSIPLTLFCVGSDLSRPQAAAAIDAAVRAGHGVGNHSLSHHYDLSRRNRLEITLEIDAGTRAIERACGVRPRGFRAPGYTITDEVFAVLRDLGVAYDSSVFPCPAYMLAKDAAIGAYRLAGRPSRSIVDDPRVLRAPTSPYRAGTPYWSRGDGLVELPIQVTRGLRLPFIGTSLMLAGERGARALTKMVIGEALVNLELHGIDLLDEHDAELGDLAASQRDLRVPVARKRAVLATVVETLKKSGYSFVTMDEAAEAFAA